MHVNPPERRAFAREAIQIELQWLDGSTATTRDVGPEGLYVMVDSRARLVRWVALEITNAQMGLRLRAQGEVLRVEPRLLRKGVAMRLHGSRIDWNI